MEQNVCQDFTAMIVNQNASAIMIPPVILKQANAFVTKVKRVEIKLIKRE